MKIARILKEKSLAATLRALPIDDEQVIPFKEFPYNSVRARCADIKRQEGLQFQYRRDPLIAGTFVTRIK